MWRLVTRVLLVCFLFSALPAVRAVETPQSAAEAQRRNRKAQKKWDKKHKAKWGKTKKSQRASR